MSLLIITMVRNSILVYSDPCLTQGAKMHVFCIVFLGSVHKESHNLSFRQNFIGHLGQISTHWRTPLFSSLDSRSSSSSCLNTPSNKKLTTLQGCLFHCWTFQHVKTCILCSTCIVLMLSSGLRPSKWSWFCLPSPSWWSFPYLIMALFSLTSPLPG